jgi:hypothetical protein
MSRDHEMAESNRDDDVTGRQALEVPITSADQRGTQQAEAEVVQRMGDSRKRRGSQISAGWVKRQISAHMNL